ncbi:hypothetical protein II906_05680 [bacterium]|nr:hypothetical protein [bacterium]
MVSNVSFSGRSISDNMWYMRTGEYGKNSPEIMLNGNAVKDLNSKYAEQLHLNDKLNNIDGAELALYLRGLNGILPQDVKFQPKIDYTHRYSVYKTFTNDMQFRDETTDSHILSVTDVSINEEK